MIILINYILRIERKNMISKISIPSSHKRSLLTESGGLGVCDDRSGAGNAFAEVDQSRFLLIFRAAMI